MDNPTLVFEDIKVALQGTTILPTPRVSRETIISVLQTHTDLIMNLRKDHKALTIKVAEVDMETQANRKNIKILEVETQHIKKDVETLFRLNGEFRKEMDELSQRVAELYVLKKQLAEQKDFVETLAADFNKFSAETGDYITQNTQTMTTLQTSCDETQFQLKEMKDYVDHFADNLVLNSQQIMVDTYSGFANRPLNLTEILRICRSSLDDINNTDKTHSEQIAKAFSDLDTKAPDSVLFNIATLEKKVGTIELHIQKEEEQGMGALRKTCEELSIHMQSVQVELGDKIDRESVGFIVHEKYEEIVRYLQDALQSSLEDETNFKQKADEIQEMVILLSNSKADRTEIANMQEIMVKSEALLKKVGAQVNLKDKIKEFVSRKEVEAWLANKVDRSEFEVQLSNAVQNSRKARYNTALATGLQPVTDETMSAAFNYEAGNRPSSGQKKNKQGTVLPNVGPINQQPAPSKSIKIHNTPSLPLVDLGRLQVPLSDSENEVVPVMAIGHGLQHGVQSSAGGNNGAGSPPTSSKSHDFGSFVKGRSQMKSSVSGKVGGKTSSLMSSSTPNLANVPGGAAPALPEGYGASEYPYAENPQYRLGYAEQSQLTDHLAYLHGPMVGGGFNAKAAHIMSAPPGANPVASDDVEGKGLMLHGTDGHLYYKDITNSHQ